MGDVTYHQFSGVRNDVSAERFGNGDLVAADNCDLDTTGKLSRRGGYALQRAGASHSLFSHGALCVFVSGTSLLQLHADYSVSTLRSGLTADARMAYTHTVNDRIYYSNGYQTGVIDNEVSRSWGLTPPDYQPLASVGAGRLFAGRYQYALTFLRSDGQESGTGVAEVIDVPADSAIDFTAIPVSSDPDVTQKSIFVSAANGDVLYRALTLANSVTTASYNDDGLNLNSPLDTQFLDVPPAGHLLTYYRGHIYSAVGNLLLHSEAFGYELFDWRKYLPFDSRIRLLAPVEDGFYLATETSTLYLAGSTPDDIRVIKKADYGAIEGTLAYAPGNLVQGVTDPAPVALWTAPTGICRGLNGGVFTNLTESRYSFNARDSGAAVFRDSTSQYLSIVT